MRTLVLAVGLAVFALGAWELFQNPTTTYLRCFNPQDCAFPQTSRVDTASSGLWGSVLVGIGIVLVIIGSVRRHHPGKTEPLTPGESNG